MELWVSAEQGDVPCWGHVRAVQALLGVGGGMIEGAPEGGGHPPCSESQQPCRIVCAHPTQDALRLELVGAVNAAANQQHVQQQAALLLEAQQQAFQLSEQLGAAQQQLEQQQQQLDQQQQQLQEQQHALDQLDQQAWALPSPGSPQARVLAAARQLEESQQEAHVLRQLLDERDTEVAHMSAEVAAARVALEQQQTGGRVIPCASGMHAYGAGSSGHALCAGCHLPACDACAPHLAEALCCFVSRPASRRGACSAAR